VVLFFVYEHKHDPKAKYQKGLHYYKEKNYQKASTLFKEAAKQGYAPAEENLGNMYLNGLGVSRDDDKAAYWYKKAAEQGNAAAEANLGSMYVYGLGVPKDYTKAVYWFKKAAEQGNATAKANLEYLELAHLFGGY